jgi:hypothetical protein
MIQTIKDMEVADVLILQRFETASPRPDTISFYARILGLPEDSVRVSLDHLIELGFVIKSDNADNHNFTAYGREFKRVVMN